MSICWAIIGSDNDLSPNRHQAIIWTNAGILLIGPIARSFSEISIKTHIFLFMKMHLKMSSQKWQPHDDVINWKHFPRNWSFVRGILGQWHGALMFSLIYVWINDWVKNSEAGDLRCYRAHYDVSVMILSRPQCINSFWTGYAIWCHRYRWSLVLVMWFWEWLVTLWK